MNPLYKLDAVLKFIGKDYPEYKRITHMDFSNNESVNFGAEILYIVEQLEKDEYITIERGLKDGKWFLEQDVHRITFKGMMFIESSGYAKIKTNEELEKQEIINEMALRKRNELRLVSGTYLVAAGAIGLIIWEMIKTFLIDKFCH